MNLTISIIDFITKDFMKAIISPTIIIACMLVGYITYKLTKRHYVERQRGLFCNKAYENFTKHLTFANGRYKGHMNKLNGEKYTETKVKEEITETSLAKTQLLRVCGKNVRKALQEEGNSWLNTDNINIFGANAERIKEKIEKAAIKDKI